MRRWCIEMDLEIAVYVMPRLSCALGTYVATLREVTNGIIENQYLRLVLTLTCPSSLPSSRPSPVPQVRSSPAIYDACSKSFGLYANGLRLYLQNGLQARGNRNRISGKFVFALQRDLYVLRSRVDLKARCVMDVTRSCHFFTLVLCLTIVSTDRFRAQLVGNHFVPSGA